jgi:hypothetical protein
MAIKLSDLRNDSWSVIASVIRKGLRPEEADLRSALLRGESYIPPVVQEYLAGLNLKPLVKNGKPPGKFAWEAHIDEMRSFNVYNSVAVRIRQNGGPGKIKLEAVFKEVAASLGKSVSAVRKHYYANLPGSRAQAKKSQR